MINKLLFFFFGLLLSNTISAQTFTDSGIKYQVTSSTAPLTVKIINPSGTGGGYTGAIVIPSTVTYNANTYTVNSIGDMAFLMCSITSISIPNTVTTIGDYAFFNDNYMTSIVLPSSITSIGQQAFQGCWILTSFTCLATTPPTLGSNAFGGSGPGSWMSVCDLNVPTASTSAYSAANQWKDFKQVMASNLGTSNAIAAKFSIFPNPAKDFVTISNLAKGADVALFDMTGKLLYQTKSFGTTLTINTSSYKNGMYLVKVDGQAMKLLIAK